ncbi:hypothetical protein M0R72_21215 [Candidatus Pacearchaeota archaeon]|jgi:hypothetical protein|nr:hypothetical protein [Candidatus Pacearchaeota archaeon]
MTYTAPSFVETGMTTQNKVDALNELETQSSEAATYMAAMSHSIYLTAAADARYYKTPAHAGGRSDTGAGCGIDAATLSGYTLAQLLASAIPSGMIGMWGAGDVPDGWNECTGANSTPDMQNRVPFGAGGNKACGDMGGANSVTPSTSSFNSSSTELTDDQIPKHQHTYEDRQPPSTIHYGYASGDRACPVNGTTYTTGNIMPGDYSDRVGHIHSGCTFALTGYTGDLTGVVTSATVDNRPPSRAVKFIMRS